ncbi:hypothetical protein H2201_006506 [Coniosporium apollinis]|uniref:Small integral membrane protein 36 n=1 Tax=Coniosporium apollinis TaxID=61459 RepID=A0ABQ9NMJ5_9PEZI|nr:hypothetical protein H2201_006506 [Coniosporium apollinis]
MPPTHYLALRDALSGLTMSNPLKDPVLKIVVPVIVISVLIFVCVTILLCRCRDTRRGEDVRPGEGPGPGPSSGMGEIAKGEERRKEIPWERT